MTPYFIFKNLPTFISLCIDVNTVYSVIVIVHVESNIRLDFTRDANKTQ